MVALQQLTTIRSPGRLLSRLMTHVALVIADHAQEDVFARACSSQKAILPLLSLRRAAAVLCAIVNTISACMKAPANVLMVIAVACWRRLPGVLTANGTWQKSRVV